MIPVDAGMGQTPVRAEEDAALMFRSRAGTPRKRIVSGPEIVKMAFDCQFFGFRICQTMVIADPPSQMGRGILVGLRRRRFYRWHKTITRS